MFKPYNKPRQQGRADARPCSGRYKYLGAISCLALALFFSQFAAAECDFEATVPTSWLQPLEGDDILVHATVLDMRACRAVNAYYSEIGEPPVDCEPKKPSVPDIVQLRQPGDSFAYFSSPEHCIKSKDQPMYAGYVLIRDGKQIAFELKVGTHNKALNWDADTGAL